MKLLKAIAFAALATACTDGGTTSSPADEDAGTLRQDGAVAPDGAPVDTPLTVTALNPSGGPEEGGTTVVISGTGFEEGASVRFGEADGVGTTVNNAGSIRVSAPAGAGVVAVTVTNPGGESGSLAAAYTYRAPVIDAVDWCTIQFPPQLTTAPGLEAGPVFARVFEESCTEGEAVCGRITAELGYGPRDVDVSVSPEAWTWAPAAANPAHTSDNNDEYSATLTVGLPGDYGYAYRMRVNDGAWTYCDLDGTDNGYQPEQSGLLSVQEGVQTLGWCALQSPAQTRTVPGVETEAIYGRFFMEGCTEGEAECGAVQAELGWGDPLVDPSGNPAAWQWSAAAYNPAHTTDDNDEHSATLTPAEAGVYAYAYRVTVTGDDWVYCDLDGADNGFQLDQTGTLTVAGESVELSWCTLQFPASIEAIVGQDLSIYGRAFVDGCTNGDAQCPVLRGQLGVGDGDDPAAFEWIDSVYSPDHTADDNDEQVAVLSGLAEGAYRYAYRFSVDGGDWMLCDLDSSENGFSAEQMGTLSITEPRLELSWCQLRFPEQIDVEVGEAMPAIYARAFVEGCTEGENRCEALRGQLGISPVRGVPVWLDGEYNPAHTADGNDEWQALAELPAAGEYRYWYRFSVDDGETWLECDLDGAENGFEPAQTGTLTVSEPIPPAPIGWCQVQFPAATSTVPGMASEPVYGQLFVEGCTEGRGRCGRVMAQLGYGPDDSLPSAEWSWVPAEFNRRGPTDANDEYAGALLVPEVGTYGYGYRFSTDEGASWTYCDSDGADGEILQASVPQLTIRTRRIDRCNIQYPAEIRGAPGEGGGVVYGQALVTGCTELLPRCWGLRMQVGLGASDTDPRVDVWRWFEGSYNAEGSEVFENNRDEYAVSIELGDAQDAFVVRFSGDGGATWRYCDTAGRAFNLEAMGRIILE